MALSIDQIRLLVGDTSDTPQLEDDQILLIIGSEDDIYAASSLVAEALAAKYSTSISFAIEGLRVENAEKSENYRKLADRLAYISVNGADSNTLSALVSGVSRAEMALVNSDPDRVEGKLTSAAFDPDLEVNTPPDPIEP